MKDETMAMPEARRRRNAGYLALFVAGVFVLLGARLVVIQGGMHDEALAWVHGQEKRRRWRAGRSMAEQPGRGLIRDRCERVLARSWYEHTLVVDPSRLAGLAASGGDLRVAELLPAILRDAGVRFDEPALMRRLFTTHRKTEGEVRRIRRSVLSRGLDPIQRRQVAEGIDRAGLRCLEMETRLRRSYPQGEDVAQLVGIVGESEEDPGGRICGRSGVEHWLDRVLEGRVGHIEAWQDARGREFVLERPYARTPTEGVEAVLTIDTDIQRICREELAAAAAEHHPESASAVVVHVETGEILGTFSWPCADPDRLEDGARHLRLGALQDSYDPGSAIKPLFLSWALQRRAIGPDDRIDCGGPAGYARFGARVVREYSPNPEPLDLEGVLYRSSNVGAVRIALERLGLAGMYEALEAFGVKTRRAVAFPALAEPIYTKWEKYATSREELRRIGFLSSDRRNHRAVTWTGISLAQGYEMRLSPLDMARIYTTFARLGELVELSLLKEVRRWDTVGRPESQCRRVLDRLPATYIRSALHQVVENPRGTGRRARSTRFSMAAKSGTSEVQGREIPRRTFYNAWFCAMAPAQQPEVVVVVLQHRVKRNGPGTYTGGAVSGPVVRRIIERTLDHLGIEPDRSG